MVTYLLYSSSYKSSWAFNITWWPPLSNTVWSYQSASSLIPYWSGHRGEDPFIEASIWLLNHHEYWKWAIDRNNNLKKLYPDYIQRVASVQVPQVPGVYSCSFKRYEVFAGEELAVTQCQICLPYNGTSTPAVLCTGWYRLHDRRSVSFHNSLRRRTSPCVRNAHARRQVPDADPCITNAYAR